MHPRDPAGARQPTACSLGHRLATGLPPVAGAWRRKRARRPFDLCAAVRYHEGDESHDYFADGLVEDIITNLSKIPGLFVIARNSSFSFRGERADPRTIAAELRVRYLLQGSLRQSGGRLRMNARLVDGAS